MGLNNMGLGFVFGAIDKGLTKGAEMAQKSITGVGDAVNGVKSASSGVGSMLASAFRLPDFGQAIGTINQFASDMKITTTQHEAYGVMADKVTQKVTAGFDLTSKEGKKMRRDISGVAFALNMDIGSVADSYKALKQSQIDVTKIGFKSFKEFQQFAEVTGLDVKKFSATMAGLKKQFKLTDEDIKDMLETGTGIGRTFGLGTEAIQGMVDTTAMLQEEAAGMFQTMGRDKTKKFIQDTQILAGAFLKAGHTAEEAQQLSRGLGQSLMKGVQGIRSLYAGIEGMTDLPQVAQTLTENFGTAEDAFQLLQDSPLEFMKKMSGVVSVIKKTSKEPEKDLLRFSQQMTQAFGPGVTNMIVHGMEDSMGSIQALEKDIASGKLKNGLHDIAAAHRDGRTMAERFSLAQDLFRTNLKHLNKELMTDSEFLGKYKKATALALKEMEPMASGNGIVAQATRMMINFSNFGIGGMISTLHPLGPALVSLAQQFGPILQALPGLLGVVKALASPLTIVVGGVYLLAKYFKDSAAGGSEFTGMVDSMVKKIPAVIDKVVGEIVKIMPKVFEMFSVVADKVSGWVKLIDWNKVGAALVSGFGSVIGSLAKLAGPLLNVMGNLMSSVFQAMAGMNWASVGVFMMDIGKQLFVLLAKGLIAAAKGLQWITAALANVNWNTVGAALAKGAAMVAGLMVVVAWEVLKALPNLVVATFKAALGIIKGLWDLTVNYLDKKLGGFAIVVKTILFGIATAMGVLAAGWVAGWVAMQAVAIGVFIKTAAWAVTFWAAVLGPIALVVAAVAGIGYAVYKLVTDFEGAKKAVFGFFSGIGSSIKNFFTGAKAEVKKAADDIVKITEDAQRRAVSNFTQPYKQIVQELEFGNNRAKIAADKNVNVAKFVSDSYIYYTNKWAGNDSLAMEKLKPQFQDMFKSRFQTISNGYAQEMSALKNNTSLTIVEYEAAAKKIGEKYGAMRKEITDVIASSSQELARGAETDVALVGDRLDKLDARVAETAKVTESKAEQMARGVSDVFNVTESEANDLLKSLMGVDPKIFQKDVEKIRSVYVKFLNATVAEGVKLLVVTRTQFSMFLAEQLKFWSSMESFVNQFVVKTESALSKFWKGVILQTSAQMTLLALVIRQMSDRLHGMVADVNLMMILTGEDKIMQWAVTVVNALQRAFMGKGNPFDAALSAAARNASAFMDSIAEKRGSLGNVTMKYESTTSQSERNDAMLSLVGAVNRPAWSEDLIADLQMQNAELTKRLDALILVTSGKKTAAEAEKIVREGQNGRNLE